MKIYTRIVIRMDTLETVSEEFFTYRGEMALCDGGGPGGGGDAVGGEGDTAGQGGTGGSGGNVGSGEGGGGPFGGWAPDPVSSGDPASGGLGGIGQGVSDGGAPVAGLAAAEAASRAASKTGDLTDADLSAMITALSDSKIASNLDATTLAKSYMAASKSKDVDADLIASNYLDALVSIGQLTQSDLNASTMMAKAMSFVTDFALSNVLPPAFANLASRVGLPPALGNLASMISSENLIASQSRQSFASSQAAKALGLPDPNQSKAVANGASITQADQSTEKAVSGLGVAGKSGGPAAGGGAPPSAGAQPKVPPQTLATKENVTSSDLSSRPTLGAIGSGRASTVRTNTAGLSEAPTLKRNTLLGG